MGLEALNTKLVTREEKTEAIISEFWRILLQEQVALLL